MKIKNIISLILLIYLPSTSAFAFLRKDMYERSNRILQLSHNQGDYSSYSQMMEMYQDMRGMIKSDLELGNPDTAVDYELLTEGLILENYQALQSLLGFNNYTDTTKEFSDEIDHTYAQKLAYALKQNKIAFQTHFDVKKSVEQAQCKVVVNGKELKELAFIGPAGIPFYIGLYCPNKMFEVKKIQAAESQKFYSISFANLRTAIYNDDPVEMGVPNPYPASKLGTSPRGETLRPKQNPNEKQKPIQKSVQKPAQKSVQTPIQKPAERYTLSDQKPGLFNVKGLRLATGAGVDWYIDYNEHYYYRFAPAKIAILLYSSTQLVYKNFEFILDIGPAVKSTKYVSAKPKIENEHTVFFRPTFAFTEDIYQYRDIFNLNFDLGGTVFFVGTTNSSIKPISYGVRAAVEPRVYLGSSFFVEGIFTATYNFLGPAQNSLLGAGLLIGGDL